MRSLMGTPAPTPSNYDTIKSILMIPLIGIGFYYGDLGTQAVQGILARPQRAFLQARPRMGWLYGGSGSL
jgi:hypothetical protein